MESLGWETIKKIHPRKKTALMNKIRSNHSAPNLQQLFQKRNEAQNIYNLQNNLTDLILYQKPKAVYLKRTLGYIGAKLFNRLPKDLKVAPSISSFKNVTIGLELNCI